MGHEAFRMLIPGLIFCTPVFWAVAYRHPAQLATIVSVAGALVLPCGWFLYCGYRAILLRTGRTYENKAFVAMLRNRITATWVKEPDEVTVDLSAIQGNLGEIRMSSEIFLQTFNPFQPRSTVRETMDTFPFLEHLSDYFMFSDDSYDYARSISSVRYGLECSCFSAVVGMLTALAIFGALGPHEMWSRISMAVVVLVIFGSAYLLVGTAWYASAEYEARLNLLTLLSLQNRSQRPRSVHKSVTP